MRKGLGKSEKDHRKIVTSRAPLAPAKNGYTNFRVSELQNFRYLCKMVEIKK